MSRSWRHSLYWRIAVGLAGLLATMLAVQAVLFLWILSQSDRAMPGQSPLRYAQSIARDLENAMRSDPELDVERYVHDEYPPSAYPFFVMLASGRTIVVGPPPGDTTLLGARAMLGWRPPAPPAEGRRRRGTRVELTDARADEPAALAGAFQPVPVLVHGWTAGVVVVPRRAPWSFLVDRFAPMLSGVSIAVMIAGAVLTSALVVGPPRRRLRRLEQAVQQIGAGSLSARAPVQGRDEIAAVAAAVNHMADDLAARAGALASSDRLRRQLLADISHELNTPITAMHGYLETLKMPEMALDEGVRTRYLTIVSDELGRIEHLIGDLLDLARLEGGGSPFTFEDVSVGQLFERVRARHERAAEAAGVALVGVVGPGSDAVRGDRDRLEQALQNLAVNALRYAPAGSTLTFSSSAEDDGIAIRVADEGAGIAAEHVPYIFDRFYKADASRHESTGSGLGLSIVKTIVERHGAHIAVTSRPGRTIFEIAGLQAREAGN